jgi:4-hydroxy-tetrahydrodipicolinate reductase
MGRMGQAVCRAVDAEVGLALVAAVDSGRPGEPVGVGGLVSAASPGVLLDAGAQVAVDFTVPAAALPNALWCAGHGLHCVVGTTGFGAEGLEAMRAAFAPGPANCIVAPNFAIGAVLMMRFAEMAAPWFDAVEIVELHHDGKLDAPSGTSLLTAQRVAAARGAAARRTAPADAAADPAPGAEPAARGQAVAPGVHVHSVRLRGLVAHQEVLLGTAGQVLTLRHDSLDRASFMPGVVLAVREVPGRRGLTVGLESLLGL